MSNNNAIIFNDTSHFETGNINVMLNDRTDRFSKQRRCFQISYQ